MEDGGLPWEPSVFFNNPSGIGGAGGIGDPSFFKRLGGRGGAGGGGMNECFSPFFRRSGGRGGAGGGGTNVDDLPSLTTGAAGISKANNFFFFMASTGSAGGRGMDFFSSFTVLSDGRVCRL